VSEPPLEQFTKAKFVLMNPLFFYQLARPHVAPIICVWMHRLISKRGQFYFPAVQDAGAVLSGAVEMVQG
jgi:hypothetical protein